MLVLVRPCYPDFLEDRLFTDNPRAKHWCEPYQELRKLGHELGIGFRTWDMEPLRSADVILFQDFPNKSEVLATRRAAPRAKFILQIVESPLGRPHQFVAENHRLFDAILTYNYHLCDERRYFHYFLPIGRPATASASTPFLSRRRCVLINSNRDVSFNGLLCQRHGGGLKGLPSVGVFFQGWRVPIGEWLQQTRGELYSQRRNIARTAETKFADSLDVYGFGWNGEPITWTHRRPQPSRAFANSKGVCSESKLDTLSRYRFCVAFENIEGDFGYISEKIFDPLIAGTVPIYLGDAKIADHVPANCFVDAKRFGSDADLLQYVSDCGEAEWTQLRHNGESFLDSDEFAKFLPQSFAKRLLQVIRNA